MIKLSDAVTKNTTSKLVEFGRLAGLWKSTVTKNIADVTTPVKLADGALTVLVHDNIWLTELNYLKEELKELFAAKNVNISKITFKYSPAYVRTVQARQPKYAVGETENILIEKILERIDNEETAESFGKLLNAYFSRYPLTK